MNKPLWTHTLRQGATRALATNTELLLCGQKDTLQAYSRQTGQPTWSLKLPHHAHQFCLSDIYLMVTDTTGFCQCWELRQRELVFAAQLSQTPIVQIYSEWSELWTISMDEIISHDPHGKIHQRYRYHGPALQGITRGPAAYYVYDVSGKITLFKVARASESYTLKKEGSFHVGSPILSANFHIESSTLIVYTIDGAIHGIEPTTHKTAWRRILPSPVMKVSDSSSPNTQIISTHRGVVYALDLQDGSTRWSYKTKAPTQCSVTSLENPTNHEESHIVIGDGAGECVGLHPNSGEVVWKHKFKQPINDILGLDGVCHVITSNKYTAWPDPVFGPKKLQEHDGKLQVYKEKIVHQGPAKFGTFQQPKKKKQRQPKKEKKRSPSPKQKVMKEVDTAEALADARARLLGTLQAPQQHLVSLMKAPHRQLRALLTIELWKRLWPKRHHIRLLDVLEQKMRRDLYEKRHHVRLLDLLEKRGRWIKTMMMINPRSHHLPHPKDTIDDKK
ncbi:MAG: hypothetical protein CL932_16585 [Deltaproteobacteria bacterium]|nr:hypothetical protein [Deltaproteobacteria bacterium]